MTRLRMKIVRFRTDWLYSLVVASLLFWQSCGCLGPADDFNCFEGDQDLDLYDEFEQNVDLTSETTNKLSGLRFNKTKLPQYYKDCGLYFHHQPIRRSSHRISVGVDVRPGEFPSVMAIWVIMKNSTHSGIGFRCTGVLISARMVLTAGHCFDKTDDEGSEVTGAFIKPGFQPISELLDIHDGTWTKPKAVCKADSHRKGVIENDVAVILLPELGLNKKKFWVNETVRPICLAPADLPLDESTQAYLVGIGLTKVGGLPSVAQKLEVKRETCGPSLPGSETEGHHADIDPSILCLAPNIVKGNMCNGDSGGPVVAFVNTRQYLYGINSYNWAGECEGGNTGTRKQQMAFNVQNKRQMLEEVIERCRKGDNDDSFILKYN